MIQNHQKVVGIEEERQEEYKRVSQHPKRDGNGKDGTPEGMPPPNLTVTLETQTGLDSWREMRVVTEFGEGLEGDPWGG